MTLSFKTLATGLALLAIPAFSSETRAQASDYPNRNITSICNFAAGTGADIFVRFFGNRLGELSGKTVIVDNKVGAIGNIGAEAAARSKPDGYTIFIAPGSASLAAAPQFFKKMPFDPVKDFDHVTTLAKVPFMLVVDAKKPIYSVAELTAYLKQKGDKASYGTGLSVSTVLAEMYKNIAGVPGQQVNYRQTSDIVNDLLSGLVDYHFGNSVMAVEQTRAGRLRALAVSAGQRMAVLPDWPTMAESGVPGIDLVDWWSVHVPAGTPKPIIDKLETWFNQIVAMDDTKRFLNNLGSDPYPGNQKMLKELLAHDMKAWERYAEIGKLEKM
jgi:tripartite-type tricarboxylate transporter receptor subunit TctC